MLHFPLQAVQAAYRVKELVNTTHKHMKDEKGRCIVAVEAFNMAKKRIKELNTKLTEANKAKKNAETAL